MQTPVIALMDLNDREGLYKRLHFHNIHLDSSFRGPLVDTGFVEGEPFVRCLNLPPDMRLRVHSVTDTKGRKLNVGESVRASELHLADEERFQITLASTAPLE